MNLRQRHRSRRQRNGLRHAPTSLEFNNVGLEMELDFSLDVDHIELSSSR